MMKRTRFHSTIALKEIPSSNNAMHVSQIYSWRYLCHHIFHSAWTGTLNQPVFSASCKLSFMGHLTCTTCKGQLKFDCMTNWYMYQHVCGHIRSTEKSLTFVIQYDQHVCQPNSPTSRSNFASNTYLSYKYANMNERVQAP